MAFGGVYVMGFTPQKGVSPPHLAGRRTGRPKGSKNWATARRDAVWGYIHRDDERLKPPSPGAAAWRSFARFFAGELEAWLLIRRWIQREEHFLSDDDDNDD